jgi:hypothetical protein
MTAAFSAGPDLKYRAEVSIEACPSRACTWAGSAPPCRRRVAKKVPAAVGPQALDAGVGAGGEHDLGDARDGEGAALTGPGGAGVPAAHVQPGRGQLPGAPGQRDEADLVTLAVQADLAGAGDDRGGAGAAPGGRAAEGGLLLAGERVGLAGPGDADPLDGDVEACLLVHQRDGGQRLVDRRRAGPRGDQVPGHCGEGLGGRRTIIPGGAAVGRRARSPGGRAGLPGVAGLPQQPPDLPEPVIDVRRDQPADRARPGARVPPGHGAPATYGMYCRGLHTGLPLLTMTSV